MKLILLLTLSTLAFSQSVDDVLKKMNKWSDDSVKEATLATNQKDKLEAREKYCRKLLRNVYDLTDYVKYIKEPKTKKEHTLNDAIRNYNYKRIICNAMLQEHMWNSQRDNVDDKMEEAMLALKEVDKLLPKDQKIIVKDNIDITN